MSPSAPPPEREHVESDDVGVLPQVRRSTRWSRIWRPFWVLPLLFVAVATVVGALLPEWEKTFDEHLPFVFQGGADGARGMLSTIAGAMISVTGLVFSITMVVVQLASSQFSPRVLSDFLSSRITQSTLGIFAATFTYALTVLRSVRGASGEESFVPQLSVTLGFLLVLASVGTFLAFIQHITTSIQVSSIVSHLGDRTMSVIDRYFPAADEPAALRPDLPWEPADAEPMLQLESVEHGYVVEVAYRRLVDWAVEHDATVEVRTPVGRYVTEGAPAIRVWGLSLPERRVVLAGGQEESASELVSRYALDVLRRSVVVEQDRAFNQDPALGVRKLVDIAERALSPGINDPTTASQVANELHRVLRLLVTRRDLPSVVARNGVPRLVHQPQRIPELIDLSLEELLHYAEGSLQVPRQVLFIIERLRPVALPEYAEVLDHWERVAEQIVQRARPDTEQAPTRRSG
ncbi:DUF2254 domain-containing protein [Serinicoccus kebangsaanensis]|uniref:DUF2254 domain-containing protein n=1 Tax=Serinicoccus kebangsaanensis TaxID=2602069 RepID=UPI00178C7035|nr:DUF2254 domain-containing protein [Serinicoccus kebangsaanensis]